MDGLLTSCRVWEETEFGKHILSNRIYTPWESWQSDSEHPVAARVCSKGSAESRCECHSHGQMMPRVPSGSHGMNSEMQLQAK